MILQTLTKPAAIRALIPEWTKLAHDLGFFHTPECFLADQPPSGTRRLKYKPHFVAAREDDGGLRALLPVFRTRLTRRLIFPGRVANDLIVQRDQCDSVLEGVAQHLRGAGLYIHSDWVRDRSPLHRLYEAMGWPLEKWNTSFGIELGDGCEAFFQRHRRGKLENKQRAAMRLGEGRFVFCAGAEEPGALFEAFVRLNRNRWGERAVSLRTRESEAEVRRFAEHLARHGNLFLSLYEISGAPVSAYFGAWHGPWLHYLQSGWEPAYARYSVATLHFIEIVKWCGTHGVTFFDLLPGPSPLKERFATVTTAIYRNGRRPTA